MNNIVYTFINSPRKQLQSCSHNCGVRAKALSNILVSCAWLVAALVFNEGGYGPQETLFCLLLDVF